MQGRIALIKCALYGGINAASGYLKHMHTCMEHLGFKQCENDPDVWCCKANKHNGSSYWEYAA
eukprot:10848961-Ditylum_brightwellii.AAC.1